MNRSINVDQLATADLRTINEIWLGGDPAEDEPTGLCLWRGEQVFTHDMLSEGTHDQNTRRLHVLVANVDDGSEVAAVESTVRDLLQKMDREGDFYPAEHANTRESH
jgi:hypothetical protein